MHDALRRRGARLLTPQIITGDVRLITSRRRAAPQHGARRNRYDILLALGVLRKRRALLRNTIHHERQGTVCKSCVTQTSVSLIRLSVTEIDRLSHRFLIVTVEYHRSCLEGSPL